MSSAIDYYLINIKFIEIPSPLHLDIPYYEGLCNKPGHWKQKLQEIDVVADKFQRKNGTQIIRRRKRRVAWKNEYT